MTAVETASSPETGSIFKPALLLMSGRTLAFAATFFIPVVLARAFDPTQFGTYKQLLLIYSTVCLIAQAGMASSLYYFLPSAGANSGRFVANSLTFLCAAGLVGFGALLILRPKLEHWLSNAELSRYMVWVGLYLFLMMVSAALEMVLISRGRYLWASVSYAVSDFGRAVASIVPVLLFRRLDFLLQGLVIVAALRAAVTILYFRTEFRNTLQVDRTLLRSQLGYALPFGLAVLVEILQGSLPQYIVAHLSSPATFAIFAVGCLSIPLVDFAASPSSDVMMVRMQENLAAGRKRTLVGIWHDTTWKLAVFFLPLVALVIVAAREIILLLYTAKYAASIPILMAWSMTILLTTLQVDGVLRVFAQTRFLLVLNLMRLAIIASLLKWSLSTFSLLGPVLVIVLATVAFKAAALVRMTSLLEVAASNLLPWRNLAALAGASTAAGAIAFFVKSAMNAPVLQLLLVATVTHILSYALLVWNFDLLSPSERLAISDWLSRTCGNVFRAVDWKRG
jgi:O-antigen/teichoic acid export membrane protein